jgi:two-component sensor histidine kinase
VNELVTNTLEHAFPVDRAGVLETHLKYLPAQTPSDKADSAANDLGEITIKDNGVGLPAGLKLDESRNWVCIW